ncbi:hypothetical protein [Vibrio crassostreae]|uniref:hypothetical protein n=1 Tax=Vibrio crassostreae TaxID=246167 RepID=UPI001B3044C3|nr:hypothetical protein [Vibrio crassostreae]
MTPYSNQPELYYGEVFAHLTVMSPVVQATKQIEKMYTCMCSCGNVAKATAKELRNNIVSSCGCKPRKKGNKTKQLPASKKYGDYVILKCLGGVQTKRTTYQVQCKCGHITSMDSSRLNGGRNLNCCHKK